MVFKSNIYLIGYMGVGKSTWGQKLSEYSQMPFLDLDQLIEQEENISINEVFYFKGENYFRAQEQKMLKNIVAPKIIATGGGTPCFFDNMDWMSKNGTVVHLVLPIQEIIYRLQKEKHKRPLIKKLSKTELVSFVENHFSERKKYYAKAHLEWPADNYNFKDFKKTFN